MFTFDQIVFYLVLVLFQAAEHVIGSVLCSPGCFSVYRCKAIRDILPQYASNVEHAFEFLTKDMGEDRWFCTLLVSVVVVISIIIFVYLYQQELDKIK